MQPDIATEAIDPSDVAQREQAIQVYEGDGRDIRRSQTDAEIIAALRKKVEAHEAAKKIEGEKLCAAQGVSPQTVWHRIRERICLVPEFAFSFFVTLGLIFVGVLAWNLGQPWSDLRCLISLPCLLGTLFFAHRIVSRL